MKKNIFNTIKFKVFLAMTALIAAVVILCVVLSTAFSEDYFIYRVKKSLGDSYRRICLIYDDASLSDEERHTAIEKICNNHNLHAIVFESESISYSSLPRDSERFLRGSENRTANGQTPPSSVNPHIPPVSGDMNNGPRRERFENRSILEENSEYRIMSSYIPQFDAYNIELTGDRENRRIILQSSAAAISENINIFNRFFIMLGLFAVILAGVFAYLISRRFTDPIHKLSGIAKRMSELDFSEKYLGKDKDEIGLLGSSINSLSLKLEKNIGELKNANLKLLQDIDLKEKTDRQRRDFLSGVSHELKTPISIIEAYAEGLLEMELSEEDKKYYCEVISDEAAKMNTLMVKLMSLMELESGSDKTELERYDLTEQIRNLLDEKKVIFSQGGINPEFSETEERFVWGDAFLIEEALINYLINAMKYSSGEKKVVVSTEETPNGKIRINVYNSGSHIPESELPNIWNSFYKADKARTRDGGSRGLGLSIVKAIAAAHGQECGVLNSGDGVVFWIELDKA